MKLFNDQSAVQSFPGPCLVFIARYAKYFICSRCHKTVGFSNKPSRIGCTRVFAQPLAEQACVFFGRRTRRCYLIGKCGCGIIYFKKDTSPRRKDNYRKVYEMDQISHLFKDVPVPEHEHFCPLCHKTFTCQKELAFGYDQCSLCREQICRRCIPSLT